MSEGQEWRPSPQKNPVDRRSFDVALGERMARVEERIKGSEEGIGRVEDGLVRVHDRVDKVLRMLEGIGTSNATLMRDEMDKSIAAHVADEERLFEARFSAIESRFGSVDAKLDLVAEQGKLRGDEANKHLEDLRRMGLSVILAAGTLITGIGGWIISFLLDKGPHLFTLLEKLEQVK